MLSGRERTRADDWLALAVLAPAFALVALALAGPVLSGDLWWHVRSGEWMLEHRALPDGDPFSHTARGERWILQEYGSQILLALLHGAGGIPALRGAGTLLALALLAYAYVTARKHVPPPWAALATVGFAVLYALKWELRPHLLSSFFVLRFATLLFPRRRAHDPGPREWAEVLGLTVLWTQLHAEALFAPLLAAAGWIGAVLGALVDREGGARRVGAWTGVLAAACIGVLLSPLGTEQIEYALVVRNVPQRFIAEWFPPFLGPSDSGFAWYRPWLAQDDPRFAPLTPGVWHAVLGAFAVSAAALAVQASRRFRPQARASALTWERLGLLALGFVMALQARRFFWLLWLPGLEGLVLLLETRPSWRAARAAPLVLALALTAPLWRTDYVHWQRRLLGQGHWSADTSDELFPVHAADFATSAGLTGNLFNPYEWGGFLGYRLRERCPVFADGRTDLFADVIEERWRAERDPELARQVLAARDVRVVIFKKLVDHGAGQVPWRPPDARTDWIRAWADSLAAVWIRADDQANLERVVTHYRELGVDFDPERGFVEAQVLDARPEWSTERRIVPDFVAEELRATDGRSDPAARLERARIFERYRFPASAVWERARAAEEPAATGAATPPDGDAR